MIVAADCPFEPGFGAVPPMLAGRDDVVASIQLGLDRLDRGRTERVKVLEGPRGIGKTSLLRRGAELAGGDLGWLSEHFVAKRDLDLSAEMDVRLGGLIEGLAGSAGSSSSTVSVTGGVPGVASVAYTRATRAAAAPSGASVSELLRMLREAETGLLVTIDEAHELTAEALSRLGEFCDAVNGATPTGPICVILAGLPGTYAKITETTYLERAQRHEIGRIADAAARDALSSPVEAAGATITPEALDRLARFAVGYPYALQLAGRFAWEAADGLVVIGPEQAAAGVAAATDDLNALYASRWAKLGALEQHYLAALVLLDRSGVMSNGAVAAMFGYSPSQLSSTREALRTKGLISGAGTTIEWELPFIGDWIASTMRERGTKTEAALVAAEATRRRRR